MDDFHILALSGGGYKGLFSAHVLEQLETQIGDPIANKFDLIAGTSIGGIIALAIALEIPAKTIVEMFVHNGETIFPPKHSPLHDLLSGLCRPRYTQNGLREVLKKFFGEKTIGDLRHRVIIPTVNYLKGGLHVIKTRHNERFRMDGSIKLVDVALSTSAAPIYFPMHHFKHGDYLDGGIVANHPGLFALMEAQEFLGHSINNVKQLHIGTLSQPTSYTGRSADRNRGLIQWNKKLIEVIFSCQVKSTDDLLRILMKDRYKSIDRMVNAEQSKIIGLDKTTREAQRFLVKQASLAVQEYFGTDHFKLIRDHNASEFIPLPM